MPLAKPRENENRNEFITRCMQDDTMREEFPDANQRLAVCRDQWENLSKGELKKAAKRIAKEHGKTFNRLARE